MEKAINKKAVLEALKELEETDEEGFLKLTEKKLSISDYWITYKILNKYCECGQAKIVGSTIANFLCKCGFKITKNEHNVNYIIE
jgi:hypothetical protein